MNTPMPLTKCSQCKKRTHLIFNCHCPGMFCVKCRTPEVHECKVFVPIKVELEKVVADKMPTRV